MDWCEKTIKRLAGRSKVLVVIQTLVLLIASVYAGLAENGGGLLGIVLIVLCIFTFVPIHCLAREVVRLQQKVDELEQAKQ